MFPDVTEKFRTFRNYFFRLTVLALSIVALPASAALPATETQKLVALDGGVGERFGQSVAVDGDVAIIGAELDDDNGTASGSAYVFTRMLRVSGAKQPSCWPMMAHRLTYSVFQWRCPVTQQ